MALAEIVVELDGNPERYHRSTAYEAAARMVLRQSDLLIALWDGQTAEGPGGTGQIVQEALEQGIPTVWMLWQKPSKSNLLREWPLLQQTQDPDADWARLTKVIREILEPPKPEQPKGPRKGTDLREEFFQETEQTSSVLSKCWPLFGKTFTGDLWRWSDQGAPEKTVVDYLGQTEKDWEKSWSCQQNGDPLNRVLPKGLRGWINDAFLKHYAWANHLSVHCAMQYRSSFVINFSLAALAVLFALLCPTLGLTHVAEALCIFVELVIILVIIWLTARGKRRRWHERWIDYRTLAERLRLARFLSLFGGGGQTVTVPAYLATYGNPAATWMHWYYRAIERAAGLPQIKDGTIGNLVQFNQAYLEACKELLVESLAEDQKIYHRANVARLTKVDHRLHALGNGFFKATFATCVLHLALALAPSDFLPGWASRLPTLASPWLTLLSAFLPALGAACAAIRSQGEFHRVVQRSEAMEEKLTQLQRALANVPCRPHEGNSARLRESAVQIAQLMANEVLDWRVVFQDRPLGLPA